MNIKLKLLKTMFKLLTSKNRNSALFTDGFHDFFALPTPGSLLSILEQGVLDYESRYKLEETESGDYQLILALPGFKKEEISIEIENTTLTITAKNAKSNFTRSLNIFETIDSEKISATLENGILTLLLVRQPNTKPRKVNIL